MSTLRYSGDIKIRVTYIEGYGNGSYRCFLSRVSNVGTQWEGKETATILVGNPNHMDHSVDCPEAFTSAASAALAFACADSECAVDVNAFAAYTDSGFDVRTKPFGLW